MNANKAINLFQQGVPLTDFNGRRIIELVSYSCGPERIDGLKDLEDIAIRCEGESEGLTPYESNLIIADYSAGLLKK